MKKILLSLFLPGILKSVVCAQTWATASLDINAVNATVVSNGDMFTNYNTPGFEVPKGNGTNTIFTASLWIGGRDTLDTLHIAAQMYRQSGNDFYPGPMMNPANYSSTNDALWNHVWKINKTTIDSFRLNLFSSVPAEIASWPGNGDVSQGQAAQLAPYVDVDADQVYNPAAGDYPCIKGDQACFVIFNDDRAAHGETGGQKLGVEIHAMVYAFSAQGTWKDSTVFLNYQVFNRSSMNYSNCYLGSFTDFDIGSFDDDYVGCDVTRRMYYAANGDANDGTSPVATAGTYGSNPPAEGVVYLHGTTPFMMDKFIYIDNNLSATGNPSTASQFYNYMRGVWRDNLPLTYGGSGYGGVDSCSFAYPGSPSTDPNHMNEPWSEYNVNNTPGDRRGLGSSGPFTFHPGQMLCVDYAMVYARAGFNGPLASIALMLQRADSATAYYATTTPCACTTYPLGVKEHNQNQISIYPNPANDQLYINWNVSDPNAKVELVDVSGKIVLSQKLHASTTTLDVSKLAGGIYLVRIVDGEKVATTKFIRE